MPFLVWIIIFLAIVTVGLLLFSVWLRGNGLACEDAYATYRRHFESYIRQTQQESLDYLELQCRYESLHADLLIIAEQSMNNVNAVHAAKDELAQAYRQIKEMQDQWAVDDAYTGEVEQRLAGAEKELASAFEQQEFLF